MDGAYVMKSSGQQDSDPRARCCHCACSGVCVEPRVVVVLEILQERVAGRREEYGVILWWDGETEMDGC